MNFNELAMNENGNYTIECIDRDCDIVIIAPHGGKIETYTTEIAKKIADDKYSYYSFIGKKANKNRDLHITSTKFDEPKCLDLIGKNNIVIAIHGCKDDHSKTADKKEIFIGGLNKALRDKFRIFLKEKDFDVSINDKFKGEDPHNICNRGSSENGGIQFELTKSFRHDELLRNHFIEVVREFLKDIGSTGRSFCDMV